MLRGLVGQRLVRRLCPHCARPSTPEEVRLHEAARPATLKSLGKSTNWHEPVGCPACARTGYLGRLGVYEIATAKGGLDSGLRRNLDENGLEAIARKTGFASMLEDGYVKARAGQTTLSEVYRVARAGDPAAELEPA